MGIFDKKGNSSNSKVDKEHNEAITLGRVSQVPLSDRDIFPSAYRNFELLERLACERNRFKAIEILIDETPDGKQAYNTYLRLANQGVNIELYNRNTGRRVKRYDGEVRAFCETLGINNAEGLDGMIDQLHGCSVARGGMACEVVVSPDANEIEDVLLIDPATFIEYKWIEPEHRYAIYQQRDDGKKIDLYEGNFLFIPHQPKAGRPDGTLQFLPAVLTMTQFYQLFADSMKILNRIGYPRYEVKIDQEAVLNSLPASDKVSLEKQYAAYQKVFDEVVASLRHIGKDSDFVHFSTNEVNVLGGGVNGSGIDIRAWFEVLEPLIVNSFNMTPVLMGRLTSGSYSLGTVEFKIVVDTINSMRRGSKRIMEEIINIWARVHGYPVYAVVTHNPINWEVLKEKLETELLKIEKTRREEEYGWISHDEAAMEGSGAERAANEDSKGMYEYLDHDFRSVSTGSTSDSSESDSNASKGGVE